MRSPRVKSGTARVRQSPQGPSTYAIGPTAKSARAGSIDTRTSRRASSGTKRRVTALKLTSNASGPTLYGLKGSPSKAAGS